MANYRQVHVHMWKDSWFMELDPGQKLLFIYLFSNERAHLSGLYDVPVRVIAFETGLAEEQVREGLAAFEAAGNIWYEPETGKILVRNLMRYNAASAKSARVVATLRKHYEVFDAPDLWETWAEVYPAVAGRVSIPCIQEQEQTHIKDHQHEHHGSARRGGGIGKVCSLMESGTGRNLSPLDENHLQHLVELAEEHRQALAPGNEGRDVAGQDWVCESIRVANGAKRPDLPLSLNFVETVLRRWMASGYRAAWGQSDSEFEDVVPWGSDG